MDGKSYKVYTLMDGEIGRRIRLGKEQWLLLSISYQVGDTRSQEAPQITGSTEDVMSIEPLGDKWRSFGWEVIE